MEMRMRLVRNPFRLPVLLILLTAAAALANAQGSPYELPAGTRIKVKMDNEINSRISSPEDTFTATVSKAVMNRNVEVIPVGAVVEGKILSVRPASAGKSNGTFEVRFDSIQLPGDVKRPINAGLVEADFVEKERSGRGVLTIVAGAAVGVLFGALVGKGRGALIGAGVGSGAGVAASQIRSGRESRIRADQEFEIQLKASVSVPVKDF
jgi:hypothetical protein